MSCEHTTHSLGAIICLENGKPLAEAKGENAYSASFIEWFAGEAVRNYGDVIPSPVASQRNIVIKQGIGVCGIMTPWVRQSPLHVSFRFTCAHRTFRLQ